MTIIAISWVGNTGKSSIINWVDGIWWVIQDLKDEWRQIKSYWETARDLFYLLPDEDNDIEDLTLFQKVIQQKEARRLHKLQEDKNANLNVIVDRTYTDNEIYAQYNHELWQCDKINASYMNRFRSKQVYDLVILLTEPIKTTKFDPKYNDEKFVANFNKTIIDTYWEKVIKLRNYKQDWEYIRWLLRNLFTTPR